VHTGEGAKAAGTWESWVNAVVDAKMRTICEAVGGALDEMRAAIEAEFMAKLDAAAKRDAESVVLLERLAVLLEQVQRLALHEAGFEAAARH
jgi:hypothetical protein